jgi:hypothetical protein
MRLTIKTVITAQDRESDNRVEIWDELVSIVEPTPGGKPEDDTRIFLHNQDVQFLIEALKHTQGY